MRARGVDLQQRTHEDIAKRPSAYPFIKMADKQIDHRRVNTLLAYFEKHAIVLPKEARSDTWKPGDVVVWAFGKCPHCNPDHIGIVSDRRGNRGVPLVIHNMGPTPTEDDTLDAWTVLGHFRVM